MHSTKPMEFHQTFRSDDVLEGNIATSMWFQKLQVAVVLLSIFWMSVADADCHTDGYCELDCLFNRTLGTVICQWGCSKIPSVNFTNSDDLLANITVRSHQQSCYSVPANDSCQMNKTFSVTAILQVVLTVFNVTDKATVLLTCHETMTLLSIVRYSQPRNVTCTLYPIGPWTVDVTWDLPVDYPPIATPMERSSACFIRWSQNYGQWEKRKVHKTDCDEYSCYYGIRNIEPGARHDVQVTCVCNDADPEKAENWSVNVTCVFPALTTTTKPTTDSDAAFSFGTTTQPLASRTAIPVSAMASSHPDTFPTVVLTFHSTSSGETVTKENNTIRDVYIGFFCLFLASIIGGITFVIFRRRQMNLSCVLQIREDHNLRTDEPSSARSRSYSTEQLIDTTKHTTSTV